MLALILLLACNPASVFAKGSLADPSVVVPRWRHHTSSDHHHGMTNNNLKGDMSGLYTWDDYSYLAQPSSVTLDGCSKENSLPGGLYGRGTCVIGLGEQLSGQIVAKAKRTIDQQPQMPPSCRIDVPDDSLCDKGNGDDIWNDLEPCPGDFSFNSTFPVQEGEVVMINYTVTGEQRFYDFLSETAPAKGYNCSWWEWEIDWFDASGDWFLYMDIYFQFGQRNFTTTVLPTTTTQKPVTTTTSQKLVTTTQKTTTMTSQKPVTTTTTEKTTTMAPSTTSTVRPESACLNYTFYDCVHDINTDNIVASLDQIKLGECQSLCSDIYQPDCQWFTFGKNMSKCILWTSRDAALGKCAVRSGPSDMTDSESCSSSQADQSCNGFRMGYCHNKGDLIGHLENLSNEGACQNACHLLSECDQYVYNTVTLDCSIMTNSSADQLDCDVISGPQSPPVDQCM